MNIRMPGVTLVMMVMAAAAVYAGVPVLFKMVKSDAFEGAIIAREQIPSLEGFYEHRDEYWTPSVEDVIEADQLALAAMRAYGGKDEAIARSIGDILVQLEQYKRQYAGLIEANGERVVWINYFFDNGTFYYWDRELVFSFEGGRSFFRIKVNMDTKKVYGLQINRGK